MNTSLTTTTKPLFPPPLSPSLFHPNTPTLHRIHLATTVLRQFKLQSSTNLSITTAKTPSESQDQTLLNLLRAKKTEEAWIAYTHSSKLPSPTCLSRLVCQLSYLNTPSGLARAQSIIQRLRHDRQLHRLDSNSLGLLAVSAAKSGNILYATSIIKSMLKSGYLPHVKAWSAVVSKLSSGGDDGPAEALKLFNSVIRRYRKFADPAVLMDSKPDTGAFNAVLNACANLGQPNKFLELFDKMPEFGCEPDVLTYNVMIKLCIVAKRKDLLVFVLGRILEKGIPLCVTTLHSLVAAYIEFGDVSSAERLVQAIREGRRDLCRVLRDSDTEKGSENYSDVFDKLLPNSKYSKEYEPPLLTKVYPADSRMYTILMKGYMNERRVSDAVRMLQAMSQEDSRSQPDHVTYTTVISAFVKSGAMEQARAVLTEMTRIGVSANRITYNILIKGYCQQLQIDNAKELALEMSNNAEIEPDVVTYNTLINGCVLVDDSAGALAYFNEMRAKGIPPSKISYTTLMKAFAFSGQVKVAHEVFDEMLNDPRVKVDVAAWNMLVEANCRLGRIEEAKKVIERMREKGLHPNESTYGSLANGIALARKPGEALLLWNEVKERYRITKENEEGSANFPPLKPDKELLDILADICVRAAFFQKALEIVACMEENGIEANKTKYTRIYVEMHSRMFTSKHASRARQDRRKDRKSAAEAFKFWLGLPNSYYGSEWRLDSAGEDYATNSRSATR